MLLQNSSTAVAESATETSYVNNDAVGTEAVEVGGTKSCMGQKVQEYDDVFSNNYNDVIIDNDVIIEQELLDNENQMDFGCLSSMEGSCDLSNFDPDYFDVEEAVVLMYEKSLHFTSYGNFAAGKAPPTVRTEFEAANVVAYFQAVENTRSGQLINHWLTKDEAIEVRLLK